MKQADVCMYHNSAAQSCSKSKDTNQNISKHWLLWAIVANHNKYASLPDCYLSIFTLLCRFLKNKQSKDAQLFQYLDEYMSREGMRRQLLVQSFRERLHEVEMQKYQTDRYIYMYIYIYFILLEGQIFCSRAKRDRLCTWVDVCTIHFPIIYQWANTLCNYTRTLSQDKYMDGLLVLFIALTHLIWQWCVSILATAPWYIYIVM